MGALYTKKNRNASRESLRGVDDEVQYTLQPLLMGKSGENRGRVLSITQIVVIYVHIERHKWLMDWENDRSIILTMQSEGPLRQ